MGKVLHELERLCALPASTRAEDALANLALERALHVVAEAIFDIGHHLLAGRGFEVPSTYREILPALVRAGIMDAALAARLDGLAGLRNILVHDYVGVDSARLWRLLDERLADRRLAQAALASIPEAK